MKPRRCLTGLIAVALLSLPSPPARADDMSGMDMSSMPGMDMPASPPPPKHAPTRRRVPRPGSDGAPAAASGSGMTPSPAAGTPAAAAGSGPAGDAPAAAAASGATPAAAPGPSAAPDAMSGMTMTPAPAPAGPRSPDYSGGLRYGAMTGMDMDDDPALTLVRLDQLESFAGRGGHGQHWEAQAWYGRNFNKLWLRSEGERRDGRIAEGDVEALWDHAVAPYWDSVLGLRHDLNASGPRRDWAAIGVQGTAPWWFGVEATAYAGGAGRTALRLRVDNELLLTQRLILQPELEANAYGRSDPAQGLGSGLADSTLGLRLRYEIRREFAPYAGVVWARRYGQTAALGRDAGEGATDFRWVAGLRCWY